MSFIGLEVEDFSCIGDANFISSLLICKILKCCSQKSWLEAVIINAYKAAAPKNTKHVKLRSST